MNERELQVEAVKRAPLLDALRGRSMTMGELDDILSTSRSTIHRALGTFEDANVVRKSDHRYALTGFGRTVAERTRAYSTDLGTALDLDEFLNAAEPLDVDVPMEHFVDAEVIQPEPSTPHRSVKRIIDLIEASDSLRMFSNILSPLYVDVACQEMLDGMEIEVILDDRLFDPLRSKYADEAVQAYRTGRFGVYFGLDIPFELFIYDDGMAMAAHDHSAVPRMFVQTGADGAVEWAEELYRAHREQAEQFDPEDLPPVADGDDLQLVDN